MAYLQQSNWTARPGAVAGVIVVHAAIGFALITGLSFTNLVDTPKHLGARDYVDDIPLPPPPPPEPKVVPEQRVPPKQPVIAPQPPLDLPVQRPRFESTPTYPDNPTFEFVPRSTPTAAPGPIPSATPTRAAFPPRSAQPRNDAASWVTEADYRSSWINRELTGTARFRLEIAADGRVANCTITASSGSDELDRATCDLVRRRARFDPAKDETGQATSGTYSSAVRWTLPE